ncbi:hypothetical protein [Helicobacter sp. 23-1045]
MHIFCLPLLFLAESISIFFTMQNRVINLGFWQVIIQTMILRAFALKDKNAKFEKAKSGWGVIFGRF